MLKMDLQQIINLKKLHTTEANLFSFLKGKVPWG